MIRVPLINCQWCGQTHRALGWTPVHDTLGWTPVGTTIWRSCCPATGQVVTISVREEPS